MADKKRIMITLENSVIEVLKEMAEINDSTASKVIKELIINAAQHNPKYNLMISEAKKKIMLYDCKKLKWEKAEKAQPIKEEPEEEISIEELLKIVGD